LLLALALQGCGSRDERTPVVVYSPHGRDLLRALEGAFETLQPRIDVRWLDMGSQEVYDRVRSEAANPQADVWFGGPEAIFARGEREQLLEAWLPAWANAVPESSRRHSFVGAYRTLPVLVWNSRLVPADEAPRDFEDLLSARWKRKVILRDPLASGTMRTVFTWVLARSVAETGDTARGFDWLRRLDAQTIEYAANPALLFEKLSRGEGLVTIWELSDILLQRERQAPLGFRLAQGGTPVINDAVGLVRGAPHAATAREFIEWIGSPAAQRMASEKAFKLPARTDIAAESLPEWAREVLAQLRPAAFDQVLVEREAAAWMTEWDRSVRNQGSSR